MFRTVCPLAVLTALPVLAADPGPFDWPQWRGPDRTGVSRETGRRAGFENFDGLRGALVYCRSSPDVPTGRRGQLIFARPLGRLLQGPTPCAQAYLSAEAHPA